MKLSVCLFSFFYFLINACTPQTNISSEKEIVLIRPGIYQMENIKKELGDSKVAIVANHTSIIEKTHLVDTLLAQGVKVQKVFAPEHGFRGDRSDGASIDDFTDSKTGLEIISLYGKNKKPSQSSLDDVEVLLFDIQDVGVRFYTYLSTLHYVMEAAAEKGIPVIVLDRPNPNGHYIDGPIMDSCCTSFAGLHPVPIVYGMTIGEYASMINGEGWLKNSAKCDLRVVQCENYLHKAHYTLPIAPSPNLPDMTAIILYPSICLFEGTNVSVGRGTERPFTVIGEPGNTGGNFSFTPLSKPGFSLHPKHENILCTGYDLSGTVRFDSLSSELDFSWLIKMYEESATREKFFKKNGYFDLLAGNRIIREQIIEGESLSEIRETWQDDLENFKLVREKYLIYPE